MAAKRKHQRRIAVGDTVYLGTPGITLPTDWYLGTVLWGHGDDLVVERSDTTGSGRWLQIVHIGMVRAAGTIPEIAEFRRICIAKVRKRQKRVRDLERALGRARSAVFEELDEIAEAGAGS